MAGLGWSEYVESQGAQPQSFTILNTIYVAKHYCLRGLYHCADLTGNSVYIDVGLHSPLCVCVCVCACMCLLFIPFIFWGERGRDIHSQLQYCYLKFVFSRWYILFQLLYDYEMEENLQWKVELRFRSVEHGALSAMMDSMTRMLQLSVQCLDSTGND